MTSFGQALHRLIEPGFDRLNDLTRVHAITNHDDASNSFTLAVELGNATPHVGAKLHVGDLT